MKIIVHDRSLHSGREKKIDTNVATDMTADSYELMQPGRDEITLVAGDVDYVPTVERLRKRGLEFHVCFWNHAAKELKTSCSNFIALNPYLEHLRLKNA